MESFSVFANSSNAFDVSSFQYHFQDDHPDYHLEVVASEVWCWCCCRSAIIEKGVGKVRTAGRHNVLYGSVEGCLGIFIIVIIIKANCNAVHLV